MQFLYYNCLFCHAQKMSFLGHDPIIFMMYLDNITFVLESIVFDDSYNALNLPKGQ